ncbi:MAG: hypothetical protein ACXVKA_15700 [Acidimicrobiia bacterium]
MDVNIRKTATDTAYVVVGVGVLGFQQAQVKRRDAISRVSSLRRDARSSLAHQTDAIKARTSSCAASLGDLGSTVGGTVGNLGSSVGGTVGSTVTSTLEAVGNQVKSGAGAARSADPRAWAEPVVGDIKVRVEPVIEQLRTISLPGTVSSIPDQLSKTIEVGRARVQGRRGTTPTAVPTAVNRGA